MYRRCVDVQDLADVILKNQVFEHLRRESLKVFYECFGVYGLSYLKVFLNP